MKTWKVIFTVKAFGNINVKAETRTEALLQVQNLAQEDFKKVILEHCEVSKISFSEEDRTKTDAVEFKINGSFINN